MLHRTRLTSALLALVALSTPTALADGPGRLTGTIRTSDGLTVSHLPLVLDGPGGARQFLTGPEGRYQLASLTPGDYQLSVATPGFELQGQGHVAIGADDARLDVVLRPAAVREQVLVAATRSEAPLSTLGASASVLDAQRIDERQASSLVTLLQDTPGLSAARAGGVGLQASTFVRGGDSRFVRLLVDGVPVNQPGGSFDLGSALPFELAQVEIVRGAASSLYGTDALAGVINLVTRRAGPEGGAELRAEAEGGSFDWQRFQAATSGRAQASDWNLGLQRLTTDNEQPNSAFEQWSGAASLGAALGERTQLRAVLRFEDGSVGTPGPTAFGRPDLDASFERQDFTLGARLRQSRGTFAHGLSAGWAATRQLSLNPLDSGSYVPSYGGVSAPFAFSDFPDPAGFQNQTARLSLGYQAEWQADARHLLSLGAELERESGEIGTPGQELLSPSRDNLGLYAQDRLAFGTRAFLTLGARLESNDSYGTRMVPRAALALRLREGQDATTLRASAGAGIKEPSFFESYGISFYARGNPDLLPERSRTFDLGLEQRLWSGRLRAGATLFHHLYYDQIAYFVRDYATFEGSYANLGRSRAQGLELELEAAPAAQLELRAAYTLLDGEILESGNAADPIYAAGQPLLRRPRHQGSLTAGWRSPRLSLGATLLLVGERADSDFSALGLTSNEGYARLDLRGRLALGRGLELLAAAENALDREYMEVLGYPALGRAVRVALRYGSRD
jgi:outer membrane cobalamin receptor